MARVLGEAAAPAAQPRRSGLPLLHLAHQRAVLEHEELELLQVELAALVHVVIDSAHGHLEGGPRGGKSNIHREGLRTRKS